MSLTKLFNFKYLMQNLKKSKTVLALFILIVPLFTTIMLTTTQSEIYDFNSLSIINFLGMYIVPFIFSLVLFGYVYKKNSVDFICSMPLSRKTIFATNTLGGILLILLTQVLTLICTFIASSLLDTIIFPALIWDVFLYQFVSYLFVFSIANLAMSISGNVMTQIVVTLLLTFAIPAIMLYLSVTVNSQYQLTDNLFIEQSLTPTYTAPTSFLGIFANNAFGYNSKAILKMVILSVIYTIIAFILFNKRKMEIATESFITPKRHLIAKSLTLLPFSIIILLLEEYSSIGEWIGFWAAIILVYWFLYDVITNKKIKFIKNIVALACAMTIITLGLKITELNIEHFFENYRASNITKIEFEKDGYNYVIDDDDLISKIINYDYLEYENDKKYVDDEEIYDENRTMYSLDSKITFNSISSLKGYISIDKEILTNLAEYREKIDKESVHNKNIKLSIDSRIANDEQKNEIINMLKSAECQEELYGYYSLLSGASRETSSNSLLFSVYTYKNHKLYTCYYKLSDIQNVVEYLTPLYNKATVEYISNLNKLTPHNLYYRVYGENGEYISTYINSDEIPNVFKKFILSNKDEKVDMSEKYVRIRLGDYVQNFVSYFVTNKVDEVNSILKENGKYIGGAEEFERVTIYENPYTEITDVVTTEVLDLEEVSGE